MRPVHSRFAKFITRIRFPSMITLIVGTNRPGSNTRKVATLVEETYAELKVPLHVLDLAKMPPEIFSPASYAEKPKPFQPFAEAVLQSEIGRASCRKECRSRWAP